MYNRPDQPLQSGGWFTPEDATSGKAALERRASEQPPTVPLPTDAEPERPGGWYVPREALERVSAILLNTAQKPAAREEALPQGAAYADQIDYSKYVPGVGFVDTPNEPMAVDQFAESAPVAGQPQQILRDEDALSESGIVELHSEDSQKAAATSSLPASTPDRSEPIKLATAEAQFTTTPQATEAEAIQMDESAPNPQPAEMAASQNAAQAAAASQASPAAAQPGSEAELPATAQRYLEVEKQVQILRRRYTAGGISRETLKQELRRLMIQDEHGAWWMIGLETDRWYKYNGTDWEIANPPGVPIREGQANLEPSISALRAPKVAASEADQALSVTESAPKVAQSSAGALRHTPTYDTQGTIVGKAAWESRLDRSGSAATMRNPELTLKNPAVSDVTMPNAAVSGQTIPAGSYEAYQARAVQASNAPATAPSGTRLMPNSIQPDYSSVVLRGIQDDQQRLGGCLIRSALLLAFVFFGTVLFAVIGATLFYFNVIGQYDARIAALGTTINQESQSVRIFDANGQQIYQLNDPNTGARVQVSLADISPLMIHATVSTEDSRFYLNPGFDVVAMIRAIFQNFTSPDTIVGASTITQQLARSKVLEAGAANDRSIGRKINEVIVSSEIARRYSKSQILEFYLNTVYYGNLAYGVEAAAATYFNKSAKDLDLAESAFLAGLVQAPALYDPALKPPFGQDPAWLPRLREIQRLMVETGCIQMEHPPMNTAPFCVYQTAPSRELQPQSLSGTVVQTAQTIADMVAYTSDTGRIKYAHFVIYVSQILEQLYGQDALYSSGFNVYTTLDPNIQTFAENAIRQQITNLAANNVKNGAAMVTRPSDGAILAMVGSVDFYNNEIDGQVNVATAPRQPGSAMKPFVYLTAFERDGQNQYLTPATVLFDVQSCFGTQVQPYCPKNYDNRFRGPVSLRTALGSSLNVPAVKVMQYVGIDRFRQLAGRVGITFPLTQPEQAGLATVLGATEVRLIDMMRAYGVLANSGRAVDLHAISRITVKQGGQEQIVFQFQPTEPPTVVEPGLAYLISDILSDNEARRPGFGATSPLQLTNGHMVAVKTGTTDQNRDNWTIGYTPDFVVGVWVGNTRGEPMVGTSGLTGAAPIWNVIMSNLLSRVAVKPFPPPANTGKTTICADLGTLDHARCRSRRLETLVAENPPPAYESVVQSIQVDKFTGLVANEFCADAVENRTFVRLIPSDPTAYQWLNSTQTGQQWARARDLTLPVQAAPSGACTPGMERPKVQITSPTPGAIVNNFVPIFGTISMPNFANYRIEVGVGAAPTSYTVVEGPYTTQPPGEGVQIGNWNTLGRSDGIYTLRLVVTNTAGQSVEATVAVNLIAGAGGFNTPPFFATPTPGFSFPPTATPGFAFPTQAPTFAFPPTSTPETIPVFPTQDGGPTPPINIFPPTTQP
ncbi:MAG: hypothetical protein OHK0023_19550 [Anaerolineae bacterium]